MTGDGIGMVHGTHMVELNGGNRTVGLDGFRQTMMDSIWKVVMGVGPDVQAVLMAPGIAVIDKTR